MPDESASRLLIVNADDFGRSDDINAGVRTAHERGILTSASLMVRWPAAAAAAEYGASRSRLSLGLHVDLGEWAFEQGEWTPVYEVVPVDQTTALESEIRGQLSSFRELTGRDPTHLDSHQHVHRSNSEVMATVREVGQDLGIPVRSDSSRIAYCGDFYGQTTTGDPLHDAISAERLIEIITGLPPGITELACHPGEGSHTDTTYGEERELELQALCDPQVRATIASEQIVLCSFADVLAIEDGAT